MHIAEGYLPPLQAALWTVAAAPFVVHGARAATKVVRQHPEARLLLGAAGAFTFVMSAIKLPSVTGSSSHPTGTGVGTILFKPPVMALLGTIVLLFQALLLAHGGITTLGANAFSMAVVGPWCGWWTFRLLSRVKFDVAVFAVMVVADISTYLFTSFQLALAHPDPNSGVLGGFAKWASVFALTQLPLAVVEGLIGVVLLRTLRTHASDELAALDVLPFGAGARA